MKKKSEATDKFREYCRDMRRVPDQKRIRILRSDGAGGESAENTYATEYSGTTMREFCIDEGILREFSPPHEKELNGRSERAFRTLTELARTISFNAIELTGSAVSIRGELYEIDYGEWWHAAMHTAAHIHNRTLHGTATLVPEHLV